MHGSIFDALSRTVGRRQGLRSLVRVLGGAALTVPLLAAGEMPEAGAARRKVQGEHNRREGGKKTIVCYQGETVRVATRRRKKWFRKGATRGKCNDSCTPVCTSGTCGDDGCGGTCGCAAGSICIGGTCEACDVTCNATPPECGATLATAIAAGGVVRVCPGDYSFYYALGDGQSNVAVIGAGNGDDPATSSILSRNSSFPSLPIININGPVVASFTNLRVTGGNNVAGAGGVSVNNGLAEVTLQDCVVAGNTGDDGGGAYVLSGTMTVDGCEFTDNTAADNGGGLGSDGTLNVTNTLISGNTAQGGGGLYTDGGTTTLDATVTITGNNATGGAGSGGGILEDSGTINVNGASVTGNTPDQCSGVAC